MKPLGFNNITAWLFRFYLKNYWGLKFQLFNFNSFLFHFYYNGGLFFWAY